MAARHVSVRMRGGYRAECRIDEFFSFVEVFVLREYDVPGVNWKSLQTIIDVGANVGAATLWFALRAPQATILAVEPSSTAAPLLTRNVHANQLDARVRVAEVALTDRTGRVELRQDGSSVFGAIGKSCNGGEMVPAVSLKDLLEQHKLSHVDFMKLDCEGAEFDIIHSSDDRLLRRLRFIAGEYHSRTRADVQHLIARLESAGFRAASFGSDSLGLFHAVRT
jgi:FkbM family methyltransferase